MKTDAILLCHIVSVVAERRMGYKRPKGSSYRNKRSLRRSKVDNKKRLE